MYGLSDQDRRIQALARGLADELIPFEVRMIIARQMTKRGPAALA